MTTSNESLLKEIQRSFQFERFLLLGTKPTETEGAFDLFLAIPPKTHADDVIEMLLGALDTVMAQQKALHSKSTLH